MPEDYEAAKQLLRYGLHGTGAPVVEAVGNNTSLSSFILKSKEDDYEDEDERKRKMKVLEESLQFSRYKIISLFCLLLCCNYMAI